MSYVGIDLGRVDALIDTMRQGSNLAVDAERTVAEAEVLADLPTQCASVLAEMAHDLDRLASHVQWAATLVERFAIDMGDVAHGVARPEPTRTPVPVVTEPRVEIPVTANVAPLWDAQPHMPWNEVHQVASHNSYAVAGGVPALFERGVRSFELDIHRRPVDYLLRAITPGPLHRVDLGLVGATSPEWFVYHAVIDPHSEYRSLSDGLAAIADLETMDPLTVFIDNKDPFGGLHTAAQFDAALRNEFGGRLFTPADLRARSDRGSLLSAAEQGWPTVSELQGRVMVVITDAVDGYEGTGRAAFTAGAPEFAVGATSIQHVPAEDEVFYNASARDLSFEQIRAVETSDVVLRTYFNPLCSSHYIGEPAAEPQYRAVDIAGHSPPCGPVYLVPPRRGSGPLDDVEQALGDIQVHE